MMKRKLMAAAAICAVMVLASGCGAKKTEMTKAVQTETAAKEETTMAPTETEMMSETKADDKMTTEAKTETKAEEKQMTGTLEENKGFMITVISGEDKEAYVFPVEDQAAVKDLKAGDKIIVTYEGDPGPDSDNVKFISAKKA